VRVERASAQPRRGAWNVRRSLERASRERKGEERAFGRAWSGGGHAVRGRPLAPRGQPSQRGCADAPVRCATGKQHLRAGEWCVRFGSWERGRRRPCRAPERTARISPHAGCGGRP